MCEEKLVDAHSGIKVAMGRIDDSDVKALTLKGDHALTLESHQQLSALCRKVKAHAKHIHEGLDGNIRVTTQHELKHEEEEEHIADLHTKVRVLSNDLSLVTQGHGRLQNHVGQLQNELHHVAATAEKVKAGLKESSSILLPNINMDSMEARMATARHGSILGGPGMATAAPAGGAQGGALPSPAMGGKRGQTPRDNRPQNMPKPGGDANAWT